MAKDNRAAERQQMVEDIVALSRLVGGEGGQGEIDARVLAAMGKVPRHEFVPVLQRRAAYRNRPLSIGSGQTISQPYIVARMTEALLENGMLNNVLEVGTGCGYQTAVLAPLVGKIYSVERIAPLVERAKQRLKELEIKNVKLKHGDGIVGWKSIAPFDAILVAAAPLTVPEALLQQLRVGGRLIVPVGPEGEQELIRFTRREQKIDRASLGPVAFVPLLGGIA